VKPIIPSDARLEIKFASYEVHLTLLKNWLDMHPAGFKTPYPDRSVNNVYFDTHGYNGYVQNLSGASSRIKVRYRWYGQSCEPAPGTLEVKCKRNYFGWKLRFQCPDTTIQGRGDWREIRHSIAEQLPPEGRMWLDTHPVPVLINRYFRQYFVSADNKVRITIDTRQAVWDQRAKATPNYDCAANLPPTLVVEVKFDRQDRELASNIIQGIPIRVSRHSKYMNGMKAISGN
jgi:hypothetical protein